MDFFNMNYVKTSEIREHFHFNNYISNRNAIDCIKLKIKKITVTDTTLKQTPKSRIKMLYNNGITILKFNGRGRPRKLSKSMINKILAMRQEGVSFYKISRLIGVPKSTTFDYWKRFQNVKVNDEDVRSLKLNEAKKIFKRIINSDFDINITTLAKKGYATNSLDEMAYILKEMTEKLE